MNFALLTPKYLFVCHEKLHHISSHISDWWIFRKHYQCALLLSGRYDKLFWDSDPSLDVDIPVPYAISFPSVLLVNYVERELPVKFLTEPKVGCIFLVTINTMKFNGCAFQIGLVLKLATISALFRFHAVMGCFRYSSDYDG